MNETNNLLRCSVNGFTLINPFILASAPPTASRELIERSFQAGWGGVVTKTIKPDSMTVSDVSPRFHAIHDHAGQVIGFENIELVSKKDEAYWENTIKDMKRDFPDRMLIASIMGDNRPETWQGLALRMAKAGADALELNFSCPHGMPEKGVGAAIGQDASITAEITAWVKSISPIPVIVKLTPNVTSITSIGLAAQAAGADALAAINTVESITGVDLDTMQPYPMVADRSTFGGYSGQGVKPIGLKAVAQLQRAIKLPIYGMGGIMDWRDAAEYIALGANAVQICTAVMVHGFGIIKTLNEGLSAFMAKAGYAKLSDFRGLAAAKLSSHESLSRLSASHPVLARPQDCIQCGACVVACRDGAYQAIRFNHGRIEFDYQRCDGCSLCRHVCPKLAIDMLSSRSENHKVGDLVLGSVP